MSEERTNDRDEVLAAALRELDVPEHRSGFHAQLRTRLENEAIGTVEPGRADGRSEQRLKAPVRRRIPRRRLALAALIPAAVLAVGFAAYALTREPAVVLTIGCYETVDLQGNVTIVSPRGEDPKEVCAPLWEKGDIDRGKRYGPGVAPALVACVLDTGPVAVFPSSDPSTCRDLGLADLPADYEATAERFWAFMEAVQKRNAGCLDASTARRIVQEELDAHGLSEWSVEVRSLEEARDVAREGVGDAQSCASFALNAGRKLVIVVVPEKAADTQP